MVSLIPDKSVPITLLAVTWLCLNASHVHAQLPAESAHANDSAALAAETIAKTPSSSLKKPAQQSQRLLPEGVLISGRQAKLVRLPDDPRWFLMFDYSGLVDGSGSTFRTTAQPADESASPIRSALTSPAGPSDPFSQPMQVLPGKWLTAMTKVTGNRVDLSIDFRVWGEITTYHGRNYVLPTFAATLSLFGQKANTQATEQNDQRALNRLATAFGTSSQSESGPMSQEDESGQVQETSVLPDKLRQALLAVPRTRPLPLIGQDQGQPPAEDYEHGVPAGADTAGQSSPPQQSRSAWKDGQKVIDRLGRAIYDPLDQSWTFIFKADSDSLAEPPVVLHPCRLLEFMERNMQQSTRDAQFRVSGQISKYQGRPFMLLRRVMVAYDLGNLGK